MILFRECWKKYPTAIVDYQTKNKSFIRLASVYRLMGIKNHTFLLALINPALQGVDPYDPNLTLEQKIAISVECRVNPFYFFREIARAPAASGSLPVPLEANRANIALFWCFFNHIFFILIQPRQTGKSFSTDVLMTLLLLIICTDTQINLLTKDDTLRRQNVNRIKDIMSELPPYLQLRDKLDTNNGEEVTVNALGNIYLTHVPQSSKKNALKMGRGLTSPIFHVDEPPFQPNIEIALPAALAAGGNAIDKAIASGSPYGTILTTTAGKKDDPDGRYVHKILMDAAPWDDRFLDAENVEELEKIIRTNSRGGVFRINGTFSHRQLGKSDNWLKQKLEENLQTGDEANRDFFNIWTSGNQLSPIATHLLERITASRLDPMHVEISKPFNYITRWYIPQNEIYHRMKTGQFIISLDTSEAAGNDDIGMNFIDIETLEVICSGVYNETNLILFCEWLVDILVTFENTTLIIERKSTGAMILDYLLLMLPSKGIDPFARIFNMIVQLSDEQKDKFSEVNVPMNRRKSDIYVRFKKAFGFVTTGGTGITSRSELYSTTLQNAVKRSADKIYDSFLIDQITSLIIKNGRVDHPDGGHDDLVISWLLAHWLITLGKNLSFYGINVARIGCKIKKEEEVLSPVDQMKRYEQLKIRDRIKELYQLLTDEVDEYLTYKLEQELRLLDKKLVLEANEIFSLDELINKAKEHRKFNRFRNQRR